MNILFNANFKALRHGEFVTANEEAGEFVLTTTEDQYSLATLKEIADANKIELSSKGKKVKGDALKDIQAHFENSNLPEQNQMSDSQKVEEIVKAGIEAGLSDDDMIVQIINEGIPFRAAGRLFKKVMEEGGHRISATKRKEQVWAILEDAEFAPETYEELQAMLEKICEEVSDTNTVQATKLVKKYAKEVEIELPKIPRKPTGGIRTRLFNLVQGNPQITKAEIEDFLAENTKTPEAAEKYMKRYGAIIEFGQNMFKLGSGEEVAAAEDSEEESED